MLLISEGILALARTCLNLSTSFVWVPGLRHLALTVTLVSQSSQFDSRRSGPSSHFVESWLVGPIRPSITNLTCANSAHHRGQIISVFKNYLKKYSYPLLSMSALLFFILHIRCVCYCQDMKRGSDLASNTSTATSIFQPIRCAEPTRLTNQIV